ncbi:MAG: trk system potassium uptake protein TrkA [Saprospiraceae bacterium]|jgi:trk system potassium uptake protein TrkA
MKIVIAGAGDMGFHLARLLASENQQIVLIDTNDDILDYVRGHLDIIAIKGDSASIQVLEEAQVGSAKMFLAVTTSEKNNLVSSILAKKMGAKMTIARVTNSEYLEPKQKANFKELGIDQIICPLALASEEIEMLLLNCPVTDNFEFEEGKISLSGITVDHSSPIVGKTMNEFISTEDQLQYKLVAILRNNEETIVPDADTRIIAGDHLYFLATQKRRNALLEALGQDMHKVKYVMILGGSELGKETARRLEEKYHLTIVEKNKEKCKKLAEVLHNTLIIEGDPSNIELLKEEGLDRMDAVVALTANSETNIIACLSAEKAGVYKTIALVDNTEYIHISQHIGVDTLINKKLIAANSIFSYIRKGKVKAMTRIQGVDAEIIEYLLHKNNQLTKKPIKDLPLPKRSMIAAVVRDDKSIIPDSEFTLQKDDKVIVLATNEVIGKVDNLFR